MAAVSFQAREAGKDIDATAGPDIVVKLRTCDLDVTLDPLQAGAPGVVQPFERNASVVGRHGDVGVPPRHVSSDGPRRLSTGRCKAQGLGAVSPGNLL